MPDRRTHPTWRLPLVAVCAALLAGSGGVLANDDHDRARQALEAGEVLSLRTILERVERDHPGQVIDVELDRKRRDGGERWIYEIKLLRPGGELIKLIVDARDGSLIERKSRQGESRGEHR